MLIHKHVVAAVDAFLEKWQNNQPNTDGTDANGPEYGSARYLLAAPFAKAAPYAALLNVLCVYPHFLTHSHNPNPLINDTGNYSTPPVSAQLIVSVR